MSGRRLFGVETEYAVAAVGLDGSVFPPLEFASALLRAARQTQPSLPGEGEGLFLGNGSRLYIDAGAHPEIAGPECADPWDVVRYLKAGDRLLQQLADVVHRRNPTLADARLLTANVDYRSGATWGSHESYCHHAAPWVVQRELIPHLVSRVVFCGAGGFNPRSRGLVFTLSPRAHFLTQVTSDASTHDRGIVNTRGEALSRHGYYRQHLICGESLRSELAAWLRVGTTALVVAMVDGGVACSEKVALARPLQALRTVASDVSCCQPLRLTSGGRATAIQIQRHYLDLARAHERDRFMPPWTGEVCDRWGDILTRLEAGPECVSATLDWAIKLKIYRERAHRQAVPWASLPVWSRALHAVERAGKTDPPPAAAQASWPGEPDRKRRDTRRLTAALHEAGGRWDDRDAVLALGRELCELDVRWGLLGAGGIFEALDRAGVLDHYVPGVERIDEAVEQPPAAGRAHVRGTVIQRVCTEPGRHTSYWDYVRNEQTGSILDLSDPWTENERWRTTAFEPTTDVPDLEERLRALGGQRASVLQGINRLLRHLRQRARRSRAG